MTTDGTGRAVPERLETVFSGRRELLRLAQRISSYQNDLLRHEGAGYAREIDFDGIVYYLQVARRLIALGAPFEQCRCRAEVRDCPLCEGTRWITNQKSRRARSQALPLLFRSPESLRKKLRSKSSPESSEGFADSA